MVGLFSMGKAKQASTKTTKKVKQDSFLKKEWRHVFIPGYFGKRDMGVTISHKPARGKTPFDYLNNRCFELSHQDCSGESGQAFRLFKWTSVAADDAVYTRFGGMRLSNDKLASVLRKYRTLIETNVDAKTPDGFILRIFCMGFTKRLNPTKKACYVQQAKERQLRDVMIKVIKETVEKTTIPELVKCIVEEKIENAVVEQCKEVYQVESVYVTKVKVIKAPSMTLEEIKTMKVKASELPPVSVQAATEVPAKEAAKEAAAPAKEAAPKAK